MMNRLLIRFSAFFLTSSVMFCRMIPQEQNISPGLWYLKLSSPLFTQEREEPANVRQTYQSHEESLLPAQSILTRTSTGRSVSEPSSSQKWKPSRDSENEWIRILLERHKEQILAEVRSEVQKHELQAESDKRSIQELTGIIDSQRMEIDHTITRCEQTQARSIATSRRNVRTKSGSLWNVYPE